VSQIVFDESLVEQLEALYATRDVLRRRAIVHEALGAQSGERVLDAGCGPGFYVSELLERVGPTGSVVGLDVSPQMLAVAVRRCEGHMNVTFREARVNALPLEDVSVDRALSVQVLEYVADVSGALAELHRVVRPGGRVVVWDVDWTTVSWHSAEPARMDRVLAAWDDHLAHPALPRMLAAQLREAGFRDVQVAGHTFASTDFTPDAYGVAAIPVVERYLSAHETIGPDVARAWADEQRELGERGAFFFACIQFCFSATRP
jgi:ubiquinone/menaquinone biosynthesis C-methylase UbiE